MRKRKKLRLKFLKLLQHSSNKVFESHEETAGSWGYIVCINEEGEEVKIIFKDDPMVEVYINGILQ